MLYRGWQSFQVHQNEQLVPGESLSFLLKRVFSIWKSQTIFCSCLQRLGYKTYVIILDNLYVVRTKECQFWAMVEISPAEILLQVYKFCWFALLFQFSDPSAANMYSASLEISYAKFRGALNKISSKSCFEVKVGITIQSACISTLSHIKNAEVIFFTFISTFIFIMKSFFQALS